MTTIRRTITATIAAAVFAISAGTALAGQFNVNSNGSYVQVPPKSAVAIEQQREATELPTIVHVTSSGGGFDWADAAIGAGAGIAIAAIVLGGGLALTQRRATGHVGLN
jgi:hypothetical protein